MQTWVRALALSISLLLGSASSGVTMDWTFVGDPGNACEVQPQGCFGAVNYQYRIGTYEVTNAQYAEFLNAKAALDPLGLYNTAMGSVADFGGISRAGSSGSFTYSVIPGRGEMPVNHVSFYDALRFANWLHNGQGSGDTDTGAYTLLGGTATPSNGETVMRNAGATVFLPSEDEWYKAAYYSALSTSYFDYPAGSDMQPTCSSPPGGSNHANCNFVHQDLTDVGSYVDSRSPYGTFDQFGNVFEWNEAIIGSGARGIRGMAFEEGDPSFHSASDRGNWGPMYELSPIGFRVASIPEPNTGVLLTIGMLGLARWRRST